MSTTANANAASSSKNDKKRLEEKALKSLRDLASLPFNKQCSDCLQKGPTYVNITMGTFVCTTCSGILRGLNPPHRVKSINMATFTGEEVDFMKTRGNHYCQLVFMSLFDTTTGTQPDSRDSEKLRDFLTQKYERKRWYTAPTDALVNQIKHENENINTNTQNSMNNASKLKLSSNNRPSVAAASTTVTTQHHHEQPPQRQHPHPQQQQQQQIHLNTNNFNTKQQQQISPSNNDLFASFDTATAFSTSSTSDSTSTNSNNSSNFANFANFDLFEQNFNTSAPAAPQQQQPVIQHTQPNYFSNQAPMQPQRPPQQQQNLFSQNTNMNSNSSAADRYSALAELDSIFTTPTATTTAVPPPPPPVSNISTSQSFTQFNSLNGSHHHHHTTSPPSATNPFSNTFMSLPPTQPQQQQQQNIFLNGVQQPTQPAAPFNYYSQVSAPATNTFAATPFSTNMFAQQQQQPNSSLPNVNPFISIAKQQSQIQKPKANSTNPFL